MTWGLRRPMVLPQQRSLAAKAKVYNLSCENVHYFHHLSPVGVRKSDSADGCVFNLFGDFSSGLLSQPFRRLSR